MSLRVGPGAARRRFAAKSFAVMKPRILIIEDEKAAYRSIAGALHGKGYELVWTQTGHEALRKSLDEPFDAALLDLNVSDIDISKALDFFCRLHPFLPILILSDAHQRTEQIALGADAVLKKPVSQPELVRAVEELLAESHHDRMSRITNALYGTVAAP
jgi:DNA-binding response OmpR family regulator